MNRPYLRATTLLVALAIAWPRVMAGQAPADSSRQVTLRVVGGAGFTLIHVPAFAYTRGSQRTPVTEPAQEGGGATFTGGLEAARGRAFVGTRYHFVVEPLATDWYAHVAAVYAGFARRRPRSLVSAGVGATVVHREQVTRALSLSGLCFYAGCDDDNRANRDGGTITTAGVLMTLAAERKFGRRFGVGGELFAATGRQRYAGGMLRMSLSTR